MNLANWLRSLGLERFEAAFRDNDIDEAVLRDLTDDHLRELGLTLGARLKLLKAIAVLPKELASNVPASIPVATLTAQSAERRHVTVMFSDLVGSTALSTRMDPEDLRKLISAYQRCVTEAVQRFGGFVAKYMGDGVLVYFGYPEAHEDDAERAVKSALELDRRSRRIGRGAGARNSWRDTQPRRTTARSCRTRHGGDCGSHEKIDWQSVRVEGPWSSGFEGHCGLRASLGRAAACRRGGAL